MPFFRKAETGIGFDPLFRRNRDDLSRQDVPDILRSHRIQGAGLRRQQPGIVSPSDAQGPEAEGISRADQLSRRHDDQAVRALKLSHGPAHRFLHAAAVQPFPGDVAGDQLRIDGGLKNGSRIFQLPAKLRRVHQISVMRKPQRSLHVVQHQRLRVFSGAASRRGIPHVSHADIPLQPADVLRMKDLVDQSHVLYGSDLSLRPGGIAHGDAAALLPSVLQGEKPVINRPRHIFSVKIVHAEDAAFFLQSVFSVLYQAVFRHLFPLSAGCAFHTPVRQSGRLRPAQTRPPKTRNRRGMPPRRSSLTIFTGLIIGSVFCPAAAQARYSFFLFQAGAPVSVIRPEPLPARSGPSYRPSLWNTSL